MRRTTVSRLAINGGAPLHDRGWPTWPPRDPGYRAKLDEVLDSGVWGVGGPMNARLQEQFRRVCDARYVVPNTSGTIALDLCLRALDIGCGDEVIVPPYTFIATAAAVLSVKGIPVFADIHPETLCLDPQAVEEAVTPQTRAVIAVHIGGMPADMHALQAVCDRHGLLLIEDCAQAHGGVHAGRKLGSIGACGAFSFQSSKNITAGEGGILTTSDAAIYLKAWSYANVGRVPDGGWYEHGAMGMNYRMTEFQAALILRGIETFEQQMAVRERNATYLRHRLEEIEGIEPQGFSPGAERCAWHLFIVRYDRAGFGGLPRDAFVKALAAEGIPVARGYSPLYRQGLLAACLDSDSRAFCPRDCRGTVRYEHANCPVAEHVCTDGSFWIPQEALLGSTRDMDDVADAILKIRDNLGELVECGTPARSEYSR